MANIAIKDEVKKELKIYAIKQGKTMYELATEIIRKAIKGE